VIEQERLPAIDGLRAVAVYLVVAFHAGLASFEGGFIGVDVFFVLSGFLITRLLIVEYSATSRLSLSNFYARRVRRLLPAAWLALLVVSVVYVGFSNPTERAVALDDARAAVFYVANWRFIDAGQDYFAESITSSPFLHLWSLAVEEQFYLLWPLISILVLRVWRRRPRPTTIAMATLAVVAMGWARVVAGDDLLRAYYGTDTRAYQLLAGAATAFVLSYADGSARRTVRPDVATIAGAGGLVGLVVLATTGDLDAVDRGIGATLLTVLLVAAIAGRTGAAPTRPERLLGSRPFVVLGGLSYATYLWHWPLVILLERTLVLRPSSTLVVVAVASTLIAKLSMDLVEAPVRRRSHGAGSRTNRTAIAAAIGGTLLLGLVVAPAVFESDVDQVRAADRPGFVPPPVTVTITVPATVPASASDPVTSDPVTSEPAATADDDRQDVAEPTIGPVPADLGATAIETVFGERDGCVNVIPTGLADCIVYSGEGRRVLLIGDSHASKLNIAFAEHAAAGDLTYAVVTSNGCTWQRALDYTNAIPVEGAKQACRDLRDVLYDDLLTEFDPDIVVAVAHAFVGDAYAVESRPEWPPTQGLQGLELVETATLQAVDELTATGATLVIVEPIPNSPFDVAACLSGASSIEECAFVAAGWPPPDTEIYRRIAASRDDVRTADMVDLSCPAFPVCSAIVDGIQVREDRDHLYGAFVLAIREALMTRIGI
jgi:peptidoglycan/LPS O-acetylase OafA/YrhL